MTDLLEECKATMRGLIHTVGIEEAAKRLADDYAGPFNAKEHAALEGMILAAFEAGQLDGMTNKRVS